MFKFIYNILTLGMFGKIEKLNKQTILNSESIRNNNVELTKEIERLEKFLTESIKLDVEEAVESAVDNIDIESEVSNALSNNFSPSDYDIVCEGDYDLDNIMSEDDVDDLIHNTLSDDYGLKKKS